MARTWLLLLLALGCPALPIDLISFPSSSAVTTLLRLAQQGTGGTPFPSLAPPITLLVDGKQQTLVVCLVLDVAPPGLESPIWFSAGNGSSLDAFTYGPSPEADGTWTSLAQLSLPSEELAAWENLVCHTGPGAGDHGQSTRPLQLSGETSSARTCLWEPLRRTRGQALRLGALRLLLFKLLLLDVLLTCSHLRALPSMLGDPGLPAPPGTPLEHHCLPHPPSAGEPSAPAAWIHRSAGGPAGPGLTRSPQPHLLGWQAGSPVWEEGTLPTHQAWAWCS
ncbi:LOW QUALITY PROTEIN: pre T-cell antigen receptor alpha [Suricata suricatta]|uniref:LOW QUALITY PROTEIN: pre T-cell antigen receptor alpha n=1 Tax=Suricata suricatta TaxID=37032 RepID=UPI00115572EB|nr:LOW QUALITY PROTEIN: pre T-cell antigen receptor alpha [Suricata suricatta]